VRNVDLPRGREVPDGGRRTPSHIVGEDRSRTPDPNGAPGLSLVRDIARSAPMPHASRSARPYAAVPRRACRARSGRSAPKRFRGMQRTARTGQLPRLRHRRELHDIRKASAVRRRLEPFAPTEASAPGQPVECRDAVQPNRPRPRADFETDDRRRRRRIRNGRAVGSISVRRHRQRASHSRRYQRGTLLRQKCARDQLLTRAKAAAQQ
jgi:hypothetical protein